MSQTRCYSVVNTAPATLRAWRKHTSLPTHPDQLTPEDMYAAAYPLFESVRRSLLARGAREIRPRQGELWALELHAAYSPTSLSPTYSTYATSPIFAVPSSLRSLAQYTEQWQAVFQNPALYRVYDDAEHGIVLDAIEPLLADVFYLVQLILVGCLLLVKEHVDDTVFSTRESRPFPPVAWMLGQKEVRYILQVDNRVHHINYNIVT